MQIPFPAHKCGLSLGHNENRGYYQTVAEYDRQCNEIGSHYQWINDEQKAKAIESNEMWTLHWYPDTPIGFLCFAACDLDALLDHCKDM